MSEDRVIPFKDEPTQLPAPLAYFTRELCSALEGMPDQFRRHGLTDAEADSLRPHIDALVAAFNNHLPETGHSDG